MRKIVVFFLLLANLSLSAFTFRDAAPDIVRMISQNSFTSRDVGIMEEAAKADPSFTPMLECVRDGRDVSFDIQERIYSLLRQCLEEEGATADEPYRLALYGIFCSRLNQLDYPGALSAVRDLRHNIEEFVADAAQRKQWLLLVDCQFPDYLRPDLSWATSNAAFAAQQYVLNNDLAKSEMGMRLGLTVLQSMAGMGFDNETIERLYRDVRGIALELFPYSANVRDVVELQYVNTLLAQAPNDFGLYLKMKQLVERFRKVPSDYMEALTTLALVEMQRGDSVASEAAIDCASAVLDSLKSVARCGTGIYSVADAGLKGLKVGVSVFMGDIERARSMLAATRRTYYSAPVSLASRAMQFVYNQISGIYNINKMDVDSLIADRYRYALNEPDAETRSIMLITSAANEWHRGRVDSAKNIFEESREAARQSDNSEYLLVAIDNTQGSLLLMINDAENGVPMLEKALEYYVQHHMPEFYMSIYSNLGWYFFNNGDHGKAVAYACKYWDNIDKYPVEPYCSVSDFNMQRILTSGIADPDDRIKALQRLLNLSYSKGFAPMCASLHQDIATCYALMATPDSYAKARENYEVGLNLLTEYGNGISDFRDYLQKFLYFLQISGDNKRHNELVAALIAEEENSGEILNMQYLQILGNELVAATNNANWPLVRYYGSKYATAMKQAREQLQGDSRTWLMLAGIMLPAMVYSSSGLYNQYLGLNGGERSIEELSNIMGLKQETIDNVIDDYGRNISDCDLYYTNMLVARANWLDAAGQSDAALEALDSLYENPFYAGWIKCEKHDFMPALRCRIAMRKGDFAEMSRLLQTPEMTGLYDRAGWGADITQLTYMSNFLAFAYHKQGIDDKAMETVLNRLDLIKDFILKQYAVLPEHERYALIDNGVTTPNDVYFMLQHYSSPEARRMAFDAALWSRGLLLESTDMQRRAVMASGDSTLVADYYRLAEMKRDMAHETSSGNDNAAEQGKAGTSLLEKIQELEADIMLRTPSLEQLQIKRKADWKSVAKALRKDEAAIEFVTFQDPDDGGKWKYSALLLRHDMKAPEYVPLIDYVELQSLTGQTRASAKNTVKNLYAYVNNGKQLYQKVWKPLEGHLGGINRVFYTTSGALSTLSFAAIEDSTRTPLCRRYDLRQLSSTANLCVKESRRRNPHGKTDFVAVGNVSYDTDQEKAASRGQWRHLDNSVREIDYVDSLCANIPTVDFVRKEGLEPTEEFVRSLSGKSPDIMLMSTHGFFVSPDDASKSNYYINKGLTNDTVPNKSIPSLTRGGLVFANASPVWNNEISLPDTSDGILTGTELAGLDFSNTRLMVLSACQTGLGDWTSTEGINGLQRALKLAGVRSMVVSMWVVDDKAGTEFMRHFYQRLLSLGENRHEAFRLAQLDMQEKYPREPYYWAPFVMID